jgi:hypothetical protein
MDRAGSFSTDATQIATGRTRQRERQVATDALVREVTEKTREIALRMSAAAQEVAVQAERLLARVDVATQV